MWISENYFRYQFRRKHNFFLMRFIIRNHSASAYFTARPGCGRYRYEMWHFASHEHIAPFQVIINKKVFTVVYPKRDSPGHIQCGTSANADDGISFRCVIHTFLYIRLHRIFVDIMKTST
jgi:hypothetical protein